MNKNCLSCANFYGCTNPKKDRTFVCKKFKDSDELAMELLGPEYEMSAGGISLEATNEAKSKKLALTALTTDEEAAAELNLENMWDEVMNSTARVPPDLVVDDRDYPEFGNFFDFATSKGGLTAGDPFPRQLWLISNMLSDACGNPKCTDPKWFDVRNVPLKLKNIHDILDMVTFYKNGVCPKCKGRKHKHYRKGMVKWPTEAYACIGQRAGKSITLSMLSAYVFHKYLKLQNPTAHFGLLKGSILTASFVALTYGKAKTLLWNPIQNMMMNSEWFNNYHALLDDVGARKGVELYKKPGGEMLQYRHRDLYASPSGPSKRTLRGDTRIFYVVDEAGLFPIDGNVDDKERMSIFETAASLKNSAQTVRMAALPVFEQGYDNTPTALGVYISSPMTPRDFIMRGVKENVNNPKAVVLHLPTWEFNPMMNEKALRDEYPNFGAVKFTRDFGAQPPLSENPFFDGGEALQSTYRLPPNKVEYKYKKRTDPRQAKVQKWAEVTNVRTMGMVPVSLMALDAGEVNNSFSVAIGHAEIYKGPGRDHGRRIAKVDAIIEIAPKEGIDSINYNRVAAETIYPLIRKLNVGAMVSDRWQNKKFMDDARDLFPKLYTEPYSLTYEDMVEFKDHLLDDNPGILLPTPEIPFSEIAKLDTSTNYPGCFKYKPIAHTYFQMETVQDTGREVTKGPGLTDDNLRAVMLLGRFLLDDRWCRSRLKGVAMQGSSGVGVAAGRSGGMFGGSGINTGSSNAVALASRGYRSR